MDLRHLRCFIALAEELHFTRAAERLHIEQSPLSRAIKELELDLGIQLFYRNHRRTQLTPAGSSFKQQLPRVFTALEQACASARAAAEGFVGVLRIAIADSVASSNLALALASCRENAPEIEIRLSAASLAEQHKGLLEDIYDVGLVQSDDTGYGLIAEPIWIEPIVAVLPKRHPLLAYREIPADKLLNYVLISLNKAKHAGYCRQIEQSLGSYGDKLHSAERVDSLKLALALVSAGYGFSLLAPSQMSMVQHEDILTRPLASETAELTTYLIRPDREASKPLQKFIAALHVVNEESATRFRDNEPT